MYLSNTVKGFWRFCGVGGCVIDRVGKWQIVTKSALRICRNLKLQTHTQDPVEVCCDAFKTRRNDPPDIVAQFWFSEPVNINVASKLKSATRIRTWYAASLIQTAYTVGQCLFIWYLEDVDATLEAEKDPLLVKKVSLQVERPILRRSESKPYESQRIWAHSARRPKGER